jgi:hypothetical protein
MREITGQGAGESYTRETFMRSHTGFEASAMTVST